MLFFNTIRFCFILFLALSAYWSLQLLIPRLKRDYLLLGISVVFLHIFAQLSWLSIGILICFSLFVYVVTVRWGRSAAGLWVTGGVIYTVLAWWVAVHVLTFSRLIVGTQIYVAEPGTKLISFIGISYTLCSLVSFSVDYYRRRIESVSFSRFLLLILFFPTKISGPIIKYQNFEHPIPIAGDFFGFYKRMIVPGFKRVLVGILKKGIIADVLFVAALPNLILSEVSNRQIVIGAYVYYFYLYLDFSGYSDLAIGLSQMMGIFVPENFNKPYLSKNPVEFWRRWHISFFDWLREYIFQPLYLYLLKHFSRISKSLLLAVAIFITFFVSGVWHGTQRRYMSYGLYNALVYLLYYFGAKILELRAPHWFARVKKNLYWNFVAQFAFFHLTVIAFLIFSLGNKQLIDVCQRLINGTN